jgi:D-alanyl-D-alanine carboxypeptidase/D-alanyl-D-alanine-endopeptidase (penicillin-binding protein 4)
VRRAVDPFVAVRDFAAAFWGIEVRSLASGRTLYALNAERAFRPASTLKLVTTAAALDCLGPDARVRTTLETAGRTDALGRVLGDVYLVGRGDPSLSARFTPGNPAAGLEALADALAAAGVTRVEGRLVGHDGAFEDAGPGADWTWEDLAWGYGAPVSALSYADNVVEVWARPGEREGDPLVVDHEPRTSGVVLESTAVTAAAGEQEALVLRRDPGSALVRLSGRLPIGKAWDARIAAPDPALAAAQALASVLERRGIRVTRGVARSREALPAGTRVLAAHEGARLAEILRAVNKESQNLYAETLLRRVGLQVKGEGSSEKGHEAVAEALARLGVRREGWGIVDGSGLARTDLVTPRGLVDLLAAMDRHPHAAVFRESLPIAGSDGTLERRLRDTPAARRVLAKTGTLRLANALAGYVTTDGGDRLAFAIIANNHAGKAREAVAAIDDVVTALARLR